MMMYVFSETFISNILVDILLRLLMAIDIKTKGVFLETWDLQRYRHIINHHKIREFIFNVIHSFLVLKGQSLKKM